MTIRKIDAGLYVEEEGYHEFCPWPGPDPEDETAGREWFIRDLGTDPVVPVAGPFDIDTAIRVSAKMNAELEAK